MKAIIVTMFALAVIMLLLVYGFLMAFFQKKCFIFHSWLTRRSGSSNWQVLHMRSHPKQYRIVGLMFVAVSFYGFYNVFRHFLHIDAPEFPTASSGMDKTIRKTADPKQQAATYRYWLSRSVGGRLEAVWQASVDAYAFKGVRIGNERKSERTITRVQRPRR